MHPCPASLSATSRATSSRIQVGLSFLVTTGNWLVAAWATVTIVGVMGLDSISFMPEEIVFRTGDLPTGDLLAYNVAAG
jgi:hypothetical protein